MLGSGPMPADHSRRQLLGITAAAIGSFLIAYSILGTPVDWADAESGKACVAFDPAKIKGLSEKLLVSHYENNYSGAVKRLNAITNQLATLDVANAPVFAVIATNSMIIHELYFDGLGGEG